MDARLFDVGCGALVAFAILVFFFAVRSWLASMRMRARAHRARAGELDAITLLEACGLDVIDSQVAIEYPIEVDGETVMVSLRADHLVRDRDTRATYIAEVKTGLLAPRIDTAATRRQLLEYAVAFHSAFGAAGVLLVDAEARAIHSVVFPKITFSKAPSRRP